MLTLLTPGDDYQVQHVISDLKAKNKLTFFEADEQSFEEIIQQFTSQSLFADDQEIFIIKNLSTNKDLVRYFETNLDSIKDEIYIVDDGLDKRSKFFKDLKKQKAVKQFEALNRPQLIAWAKALAVDMGLEITNQSINQIIERSADQQWLIQQALQKLKLSQGAIDEQTVKDYVPDMSDVSIFELIDTITSGNRKKALADCSELLKEHDAFYITSMLAWQMHNLTVVKLQGGKSDAEIAKLYRMSPFVVRKCRNVVQRLDKNQLATAVDVVARFRDNLTTLTVDKKQALNVLIVELCEQF